MSGPPVAQASEVGWRFRWNLTQVPLWEGSHVNMLLCPIVQFQCTWFFGVFLSNISSKTYFDYYYTPFNSLQQKGSKRSESSLVSRRRTGQVQVSGNYQQLDIRRMASSVPPKNRCWKMSRKGLAGLFLMSGIKCVKGDNLELPKSLQCFVDWEFFFGLFLIQFDTV